MQRLMGQIAIIPDGHSFIPRAIQWFTMSTVYHVVIAVDEHAVLSAEPGGAVLRPMSYYPNAIWSQYNLTQEQAQGCADWARARVGRPYNYVADFIIGCEVRTGWVAPEFIVKHFSSDASYECAELADAALSLGAGITVFDDGREFGQVYPGSFEKLFRAKGWMPLESVATRPK